LFTFGDPHLDHRSQTSGPLALCAERTRLAHWLLQNVRHFQTLESSEDFAQFVSDRAGICAGVTEIADDSASQWGRRSDACAE
jgi:hypothetical protein